MVKMKNKKSNLSETYAKKRKQQLTKKTLSPFEVHVNKDKQKVLGRKSKADQGLPGIARTKAIAKRKITLLQEYKVKDKDNIFLDRRIGEKNSGMTVEDRAMARFAAERIKAHKKKDIFNLNDDEILTHRGQSLIEVEKYDDPRSDDDEDDDENKTGKLDKNFVNAHFGGGVLSKPDTEMSRKDLIEQLIAESKKRKAERQKIREQTIDLTEKLDSEWRDLLPIVASSNKALENVEEKADDYDIAMRQLKFEARGMPTDKLRPEEEIAKEGRVKLEKLEEDRLARMQGFSDESEFQKKHKSADDLDDLHIEKIVEDPSDNEEEDQKGIILNQENGNKDEKEGEEEEDDDNDEDNDSDEAEEEESDESNEGNESQEESEDDLSDLKTSDSSEDEEDSENMDIDNKKSIQSTKNIVHKKTESMEQNNVQEKIHNDSIIFEKNQEIVQSNTIDNRKTVSDKDSKSCVNISEQEAIMEKARKELPYTFTVPETYQELLDLFNGRNPDYQSVITERIIKCNHWKLAEKNKEKLSNLFSFILKYLNDCSSIRSLRELVKFFQIFDRLCPHLYDLTHADPVATKNCIHDILKEKHDQFESKIKVYPGLDTLFLFKLISALYPTSDFRHPIVTPCLVFMSQILLRCKIKGKRDISKGLFVCTLILEYTLLNKRWSPAVINFLRGILYVSLPKPFSRVMKAIPPFKTIGETSNILVLEENHKKSEMNSTTLKMRVEDLFGEEMNDEYKIRTFVTAVNLLSEFLELCSELDAAYSIFEPILTLLKCGSVKRYPKYVRERVQVLISGLEKLKEKKLEYLTFDKKKPKALRMYEPRIEVVHEGKKHKPMSKAKAEREKLLHKLKKETKSAIREIRRDNVFLSKVKIKQQITSDNERKRRVKEIFGDAAEQQSELKKFKKK